MAGLIYSVYVAIILAISLTLMGAEISPLQGFFLGMVVMILVSIYPDYLNYVKSRESVKKCKE